MSQMRIVVLAGLLAGPDRMPVGHAATRQTEAARPDPLPGVRLSLDSSASRCSTSGRDAG
jgi:hypothetical protein